MMRIMILSAAGLAATALAASEKCKVSDFTIEGFTSTVIDGSLKLTGKLKNNCTVPAGAQIKITAEDGKGNVVDTTEGWPASIRNIASGATYSFNFGPLMTYRKNMKKFQVEVIDARIW